MIVALCSTGKDMDADLDTRFGRCSNFVFFDTETRDFVSETNTAREAAGGAGSMAVQQLVNFGAGVLIAPEVGPQAMDALLAMEIPVFKQGDQNTCTKVIEAWEKHSLKEQHKASVAGMHRA